MQPHQNLEIVIHFDSQQNFEKAKLECALLTFNTDTLELDRKPESFTQIAIPTLWKVPRGKFKPGKRTLILKYSCVKPPVPYEKYNDGIIQILNEYGTVE